MRNEGLAVTKYKDHLRATMALLAHKEPRFIAMGYNCCESGGYAGGMLKDVPDKQILELPLAERLNSSVAIGMSLGGYIPMLWCERFDFFLLMLDGVVNHADKLEALSGGIHRPGIIYVTAIGKRTVPLFSGPTHTQDFTVAVQNMVGFPVRKLMWGTSIIEESERALDRARKGLSTLLVIDNDLLETA